MNQMLGRLRQQARSWPGRRISVEVPEHTRGRLPTLAGGAEPVRPAGSAGRDGGGIFGDLRCQMDHVAIYDLEAEVMARLGRYAAAGLLSYYDAELEPGPHGNLVLFGTREVPAEWHMGRRARSRRRTRGPATIAACACTGAPFGARLRRTCRRAHPVPRLRAAACLARAPPVG